MTASLRAPRGWWEWVNALQELAPSDGAVVTGLAWGSHCWRWGQGVAADRRATPVPLADFAAQYRPGAHERSVRRHLVKLVRAGLLEVVRGHSRHSPNVYAPMVPSNWQSAKRESGHQWPVLNANSGHQRPVKHVNSGQEWPVLNANSGHEVHQQGPSGDIAPFSPEVVQRPPTHARTHTHARTRTRGGEGGLSLDSTGRRALLAVLARVPKERAGKIAPGYLEQLARLLEDLVDRGWSVDHLAGELTARELETVSSPGAALIARAQAFALQPSPPERAEMREKSAEIRGALQECVHGASCQSCPFCRKGAADPDGEICTRCVQGQPIDSADRAASP